MAVMCSVKEENTGTFQSKDNLHATNPNRNWSTHYIHLASSGVLFTTHFLHPFPSSFTVQRNYPDTHPPLALSPALLLSLSALLNTATSSLRALKPASVVCCICRGIIPRWSSAAWVLLLLPLLLLCRAITA